MLTVIVYLGILHMYSYLRTSCTCCYATTAVERRSNMVVKDIPLVSLRRQLYVIWVHKPCAGPHQHDSCCYATAAAERRSNMVLKDIPQVGLRKQLYAIWVHKPCAGPHQHDSQTRHPNQMMRSHCHNLRLIIGINNEHRWIPCLVVCVVTEPGQPCLLHCEGLWLQEPSFSDTLAGILQRLLKIPSMPRKQAVFTPQPVK